MKQRCSSKAPTGLVVLWNGPPDGSSGDTWSTKYRKYEKRTFSGRRARWHQHVLAKPRGSTTRARRSSPEIMTAFAAFAGQSGRTLAGYARASSGVQTVDLQRAALRVDGRERILQRRTGGARGDVNAGAAVSKPCRWSGVSSG